MCFSGDTLSFIGDQTSYMSICVGEDDSLSQLSAVELRQKVNSFPDMYYRARKMCHQNALRGKNVIIKQVVKKDSVCVAGDGAARLCQHTAEFKQ